VGSHRNQQPLPCPEIKYENTSFTATLVVRKGFGVRKKATLGQVGDSAREIHALVMCFAISKRRGGKLGIKKKCLHSWSSKDGARRNCKRVLPVRGEGGVEANHEGERASMPGRRNQKKGKPGREGSEQGETYDPRKREGFRNGEGTRNGEGSNVPNF